MLAFWKKTSAAVPPRFQWTESTITKFKDAFHAINNGAAQDGYTQNLECFLTQKIEQRHSWDLTVETTYFGWVVFGITWHQEGAFRLPLICKISEKKEDSYAKRDPRADRAKLPRLGSLYLRKFRDEGPPDGIEIILSLDSRRYRSFSRAIRLHQSQLLPHLTIDVRQLTGNVAPEGIGPYDIISYWLVTLPLDQDGADRHPYAVQELDGVSFA